MMQLDTYIQELNQRFGIAADAWDGYRFFPGGKGIYIVNKENLVPANVNTDATGLFFLKTKIRHPKMSTAAAMLFGHLATKNVVTLTREQVDAFMRHETVELAVEQLQDCQQGYVLARFEGVSLGIGVYFPPIEDVAQHRLQSLFPKHFQAP